jgi:hypothetical protein
MLAIMGIILADVIVVLLFIYHYRQELGLTVNGSHDLPVSRKKPDSNKAARQGPADDRAKRGQIAATEGATRTRTMRSRGRDA